jgi:hypothetical protein
MRNFSLSKASKILLIFFSLISDSCFSQSPVRYTSISSNSCTINGIILDSLTPSILLSKFKNFSSKSTIIDNYDYKKILRINYGKSYFDFKGSYLQNFHIESSLFYFGKYKIGIGDNDEVIKNKYTESWSHRKNITKINYKVWIDVGNTGKNIVIDIRNHKISSIEDNNVIGYE